MRVALFIISFIVSCHLLSAQEGAAYQLKGRLIDAEYKDPVRYATILVVNRNKGTSSSFQGKFNIPVFLGDKIRFSSIGYETLEIEVDESTIESLGEELMLFMIPKVYELDSVVVFELGDDFYLKRKRGEPIQIIGLPTPPENPTDWTKPQVTWGTEYGGGVTISGLLNIFDRKLQEQKKLDRMMTAKNLQLTRREKITSKFNKKFVKMITGIDDRVIDEFMQFCNFSDHYILQASEYELTLGLIDKYKLFLRR